MNTALIKLLKSPRMPADPAHKDRLRKALANFSSLQRELNYLDSPEDLHWLSDMLHWEAHHGRRMSFMRKLYTRYNRLRFDLEWGVLRDRAVERPPGQTVVQ